tara:strand:- start:410 stop:634 length:225 start_codon:yes stop_codon:yes gene_type:complete
MILFLLLTLTSFAEDNVVYKKTTEIDFEGVEVEGQLVKPQGSLILERRRAAFNPLIRIRKDFNVEIKESINNIK